MQHLKVYLFCIFQLVFIKLVFCQKKVDPIKNVRLNSNSAPYAVPVNKPINRNAGTSDICSGTLNIVWKDDFGSGTLQSSVTPNPNITNGYVLQDNGVHEGNYGIVNKFNYHNSWHTVLEDHTPNDTNGYFLVIDGNSNALIFYDITVNNLCPNTRYSFSTAVMNMDLPQFPSDQTFTFIISDINGNRLTTWTSPAISVTDEPTWNKLGFSFMSGNNTSLRLQIQFNHTGYDDFAFDDIQFSICGPTLSINTLAVNGSCADTIKLTSVLGAGYATPVYQWQKKNNRGVFENIPGATSADYTDRLPGDTNVYNLIVGDGSLSCPVQVTKEVIMHNAKKANIDSTICFGGNVLGHTESGTYMHTLRSSGGCDSVITINLTVLPLPLLNLGRDTVLCKANTILLDAGDGFTSYLWQDGSKGKTFNAANAGLYWAEVKGANGCAKRDSIIIGIGTVPAFDLHDTTLCSQQALLLKSPVTDGNYYLWNNGSTNQSLLANVSGSYWLEVTNNTGCVFRDTVLVKDNPLNQFSLGSDTSFCGNINLQLGEAIPGSSYLWNTGSTAATITATTPGMYWAEYSLESCSRRDTVLITTRPAPAVKARKSNDIDCGTLVSQLSGSGALFYSWSPGTGLSDSTIANPVATISASTTYLLKGIDNYGCTGSDTVTVKVTSKETNGFWVPGAFTPNGDGHNDCFGVSKWGNVNLLEFSIYNRWGEKVFSTTNTRDCWDGTFKGHLQNIGTFVYVIRAQTSCGFVMRKGMITLIR